MLQTIKTKGKECGAKVKNFYENHQDGCFYAGCIIAGSLIGIGFSKYTSAKWNKMRKSALDAYRNNDTNYDFGPYKVAKFFNPNTKEFIGDTIMLEDLVNVFLEAEDEIK